MIPGVKFLLMGESGTGKTHAIRTWIEAGITPYVVFLDLQGLETMADAPAGKWHHRVITPAISTWATLKDLAKKENEMSFDGLAQLRGINKKQYGQWYELLSQMEDFKDAEGSSHGDVHSWGSDRVLVIDGLSGVSDMAMAVILGAQPVRAPADYGVAMKNIDELLTSICHGCMCHVMLIGHVEPEIDEVAGSRKIMVSTLGKKLAPVLPRYFSDVVLAQRSGAKFTWTTDAPNTTLKAKNLPYKGDLKPTFVDVVEAWKRRGGRVGPLLPKEAAK